MEELALLIAILALVVAILAFRKAGGEEEVRKQMRDLSATAEAAREKTADVLDRLEQAVRGKEKTPPAEPGAPGPSPEAPK